MERYIRKFSEEITTQYVGGLLKKNGLKPAEYRSTPGRFKIVSKTGFKVTKEKYPDSISIDILKSALDKIDTKDLFTKVESILKDNNINYNRNENRIYIKI